MDFLTVGRISFRHMALYDTITTSFLLMKIKVDVSKRDRSTRYSDPVIL